MRQLSHVGKEGGRLADEKSHICQELKRTHRDTLCLRRSNDRTVWKGSTQERARFRHDQGLVEELVFHLQIAKLHSNARYRIDGP